MPIKHGIYYTEATTIEEPSIQYGFIPCFVGTAPVNMAEGTPADLNVPVLVSSMSEFRQKFGYVDDFSYTLCEAASYYFEKAKVAPILCINVLDPATHKTAGTATGTRADGVYTINATGVIASSVSVTMPGTPDPEDPDTPVPDVAVASSNYILSFASDGKLVVTPTETSVLTSSVTTITAAFNKLTPSSVTSSDVVGTINPSTGVKTGIQAVDYVLAEIGQPPGAILSPGFSHLPAVTAAMVAKAANVSGLFPVLVYADIDSTSSGSRYYGGVKAWKDANGYNDPSLVVCFPMIKSGDKKYHLSTVVAATQQKAMNMETSFNTPCESPSNKSIVCDSLVNMNDDAIVMDKDTGNILNGQGVVTAIRMAADFVAWGNYNSSFPENTSDKDKWISTRAMFNYIVAFIILAYWNKVDSRSTKTNIKSIEDSINNWLAGLVAKEVLVSASVTFNSIDADGVINFDLSWADTKPAQAYQFNFSFDTTAYANFSL